MLSITSVSIQSDHFLFCLPFLSVCFMPKIVFIVAVEFGNHWQGDLLIWCAFIGHWVPVKGQILENPKGEKKERDCEGEI